MWNCYDIMTYFLIPDQKCYGDGTKQNCFVVDMSSTFSGQALRESVLTPYANQYTV